MRTVVGTLLLVAIGSSQDSLPPPAPSENQSMFGAHLQRSMTLLATSSKDRHWPVKVLIYGQSITGSSKWTAMMEAFLKERFPDAEITLENRSIGGFSADRLVRTSVHDLYPFYPDLLIFHVYGGERTGELERIFSNVRRYTTADILLFTHHQNRDQKFVPDSGPKFIRYLAQKYDCELVDVSVDWPQYLKEHNFPPERLLRDNVHPNEDGYALLTNLIGRHLRYNPVFRAPSWDTVRRYEAKRPADENVQDEIVFSGKPWRVETEGVVGESPSSSLKLKFEGNRIDVITAHVKGLANPGTAKVLVDGMPPSADPRLYAITLPSKGPQTWFPSIRLVSHEKPLLVEDWTLRITEMNADASQFRFEVRGTKTGPDGSGSNQQRFVSNSGRVVIEPRDWMLAQIKQIFKQPEPAPVGFEVKWSVKPMFEDVFAPPKTEDAARIYQTTVAQGLENREHTLEIVPNGDGPIAIEAIQIHRPPLK